MSLESRLKRIEKMEFDECYATNTIEWLNALSFVELLPMSLEDINRIVCQTTKPRLTKVIEKFKQRHNGKLPPWMLYYTEHFELDKRWFRDDELSIHYEGRDPMPVPTD